MIDYIVAAITALLLIVGALFALAAAIGLVRLPDLYTRMHSASKAGTVGSGLLLLAAGLYSQDLAILARAIAGFIFFLLTAPVSAHLLARTAHRSGYDLGELSVRDDIRDL
ncbi:monovalent cation/H(+) antiporter subunit G [Rhizobium leguminosarum]|jgi:multicomponent Na+:H+ antiporter subunit G|uniref:monovalent cation/H(+) antiporter subunit G n=1 Tax=Rhizobium TaxID=379 RepID=UPI0003706CA7|nr:monovalent cation/H(+) antiporter subunit G [Rhizobium leguminosarum]MBY5404205.1 monovalent cation/H(+) antiporter subunit G [Rhizobium leguminosarum]MBY5446803.1 monovalent cation/H(+) antiporter subunit G [Rhizobium leguminosarum]UWM76723.1 monovalent cation/H(+) antiporter subunit G [Rhizobium leguminosarum bv. viciae]UWM82749.1 monovalent cation/H(+) antiporter subunit G [Rhizobium leguminosarum bv. viciae]UWU29527.1 monovalent cation/H(+) antiporter subunit G [Rhizobium leguminosarum 